MVNKNPKISLNFNICRICLNCNDEKVTLNQPDLITIYETVTGLMFFHKEFEMPTLACIQCVETLRNAHNTIQQAQATERQLYTLFNKLNYNESFAIKKLHIQNDSKDTRKLIVFPSLQNLTEQTHSHNDASNDVKASVPDIKFIPFCSASNKNLKKAIYADDDAILKVEPYENLDTNCNDKKFQQVNADHTNNSIDLLNDIKYYDENSIENEDFNITYKDHDDDDDDDDRVGEENIAIEFPKTEIYETVCVSLKDNQNENIFVTNEEKEDYEKDEGDEVMEEMHLYNKDDLMFEDNAKIDTSYRMSRVTLDDNVLIECEYQTNSNIEIKLNEIKSNSDEFYCKICNCDFSTKTNLTRHINSHHIKKPYYCNLCTKAFTQNGSLKLHMMTHTGEKPYKCDICGRSFTQKKTLIFHNRRHTGQKPFICKTCNLGFRQKDGLKMHILKTHFIAGNRGVEEAILCSICQMRLDSKEEVDFHAKHHINDFVFSNSLEGNVENSNKLSTEENVKNIFNQIINNDNNSNDDECSIDVDFKDMINSTISTNVGDNIKVSMNIRHFAKKFQCRKCYKCFAIKSSLERHILMHEKQKSK